MWPLTKRRITRPKISFHSNCHLTDQLRLHVKDGRVKNHHRIVKTRKQLFIDFQLCAFFITRQVKKKTKFHQFSSLTDKNASIFCAYIIKCVRAQSIFKIFIKTRNCVITLKFQEIRSLPKAKINLLSTKLTCVNLFSWVKIKEEILKIRKMQGPIKWISSIEFLSAQWFLAV